MNPVYNHPDIRNENYTTYMDMLLNVRTRLTMAAVEYRQAEAMKHEAMLSKSAAKWTNMSERLSNKIAKLDEAILKIEADLRAFQTLNNEITNSEAVLKDLSDDS